LLYSLLQPFARDIRIFNLLNYITFRSAAAFVTALIVSFVLGPLIINRLRAMAVHQVVRAGTPDSHRSCPCCCGRDSTIATCCSRSR
jgi:phospho-N-acetylmuramoyl-pentapeptide-transferase